MTTKTGEKLRGRKRPKDVLTKAWATRRKNKAAAKRAAAKLSVAAAQASLNRQRNVMVDMVEATKRPKLKPSERHGSKTPTPKRKFSQKATARAGSVKKTRRSKKVDWAVTHEGGFMYSDMAGEMRAKNLPGADGERPPSMPVPPAQNRFDIITENLLAAAGSNNRQAHRQTLNDAVRRLIADERYDAEENLQRAMKELNGERAICEMLADYEVYNRLRVPNQPYVVMASAMDVIVQILRDKGFTPKGVNRQQRTMGLAHGPI